MTTLLLLNVPKIKVSCFHLGHLTVEDEAVYYRYFQQIKEQFPPPLMSFSHKDMTQITVTRALNPHALCVRHTHLTSNSRSHALRYSSHALSKGQLHASLTSKLLVFPKMQFRNETKPPTL